MPYRIVGGTRFFDRAEIRDVMAYLKAVVNPADEISLKRIINTPKRSIGGTTVERIDLDARQSGTGFEDALRLAVEDDRFQARTQTALAGFIGLLDEMRSMQGDLRDLVEMVVARAGLIEALEAENTDEARGRADNIREFFGVVSEFAENHEAPDLPAFMEWLALRTDLDSLAEGEEYVTLMTVHTAKGLEYPVVFVAGLEESIFPHANSMFDPSGLEEERRLAYVAITRARERLYLTHAHARSIYGTTQHNPTSRFVGEIPAECVEASGVGSLGVSGSGWEKRGDRRGTSGHGSGAGAAPASAAAPAARVFGGGARQARAAQAQAADRELRRGRPGRPQGVRKRSRRTSVNGDALEITLRPHARDQEAAGRVRSHREDQVVGAWSAYAGRPHPRLHGSHRLEDPWARFSSSATRTPTTTRSSRRSPTRT